VVDKVIFYWSGRVPQIGQLALASALEKFPDAEVHLYLDQDEGFESSLPAEMNWVHAFARFKVLNFSLQEMLSRQGFSLYNPSRHFRERFANAVFQAFHSSKLRKRSHFTSILKTYFPHWHHNRIYGWSRSGMVSHSIRWGGVVYRDDLFKLVVHAEYPGEGLICSDLDVCFVANSESWPLESSFLSRWGHEPWGNPSVLYFHPKRERLTREFRASLDALVPASPWHFFSDERCKSYGLTVLPTDLFDPIWSEGSLSQGNSDLFFQDTEGSVSIVKEIEAQNLAVHWHNHWNTVPEAGSPFSRFMERLDVTHGDRRDLGDSSRRLDLLG